MRQGITTHKVYEADARYLDFIASGTNIGEHKDSGSLRSRDADISESHKLDGLRVAIEIKPVNLHLKFPFCVIGGVLVIPTWEETGTRAAKKAEKTEEAIEEEDIETLVSGAGNNPKAGPKEPTEAPR